jgi:hypothetical protein
MKIFAKFLMNYTTWVNFSYNNYSYLQIILKVFLYITIKKAMNIPIIIEVTYDELVTLINSNLLNPGLQYLITDFNTRHYIVDANSTRYTGSTNEITGINEPLIVTATSTNTIDKEAKSSLYPQDIIYYDWNIENWLNDISFANAEQIISGFTGVITFRQDTLLDNYMGYDFRNVKFRRWETLTPTWDPGTIYNKNYHTNYQGYIYISLSGNTNQEPNSNSDYWVQLLDLSLTTYWNNKPSYTNGITSNPNVYADFLTFVEISGTPATYELSCRSNHFENSTNERTILSNNVFFLQDGDGYTMYDNKIASGNYGNTIGSYFYFNIIETYFYNNIISNIFNENIIGNNFSYNTTGYNFYANSIGNDFYSNSIGHNFYYNNIGNNIESNTIGPWFSYNTIGNSFYNNIIGKWFSSNNICNNFTENNIGNNFYYNNMGNTVSLNIIGNNFEFNMGNYIYSNTIGNYFQNNTLGVSFLFNKIEDNFSYNTIGTDFDGNTIRTNFNQNNIGNSFGQNTIGINFTTNVIGNLFNYNTIGNYFYSNSIGNNFEFNTIGNIFNTYEGNGFQYNVIGNLFSGNTITTAFDYNTTNGVKYNTIGNSFKNNKIHFFENNTIGNNISNLLAANQIFQCNTITDKIDFNQIDLSLVNSGSGITYLVYQPCNVEILKSYTGTIVLKIVNFTNIAQTIEPAQLKP